jgi:hypothetical protein
MQMHEIYQDEIEERALHYRGLSGDALIDALKVIKKDCLTAGIRLEYSKTHALNMMAILNELSKQARIIEFPDDIIEWMTDYLKKRNKIHPETPKIVSIW